MGRYGKHVTSPQKRQNPCFLLSQINIGTKWPTTDQEINTVEKHLAKCAIWHVPVMSYKILYVDISAYCTLTFCINSTRAFIIWISLKTGWGFFYVWIHFYVSTWFFFGMSTCQHNWWIFGHAFINLTCYISDPTCIRGHMLTWQRAPCHRACSSHRMHTNVDVRYPTCICGRHV